MVESHPHLTEEPGRMAHNAFRVSLVVFIPSALLSIAAVVFSLAAEEPMAPAFITISLALVSLGCAWFSRHERATQAMYVLAGAYVLTILATVPMTLSMGTLLALNAWAVASAIAVETLPPHETRRVVMASAAASVFILLLDLFWPGQRGTTPAVFRWSVPALTAVAILLLTVAAVRQFNNYGLRDKVITTNVTVVIVAVIGVTFIVGRTTTATLTKTAGANLSSFSRTQALALGELLASQIGLLQSLSLNEGLQAGILSSNEAYPNDPIEIRAEIARIDNQWGAAEYMDPLVQARLTNTTAQELLEFRNRFRSSVEVIVTDLQGAIVAGTSRPEHYHQSEEVWWQAAYNNGKGATYIGSPAIDEIRRIIVVKMAVPVFASNSSRVIGVLGATYSLRDMRDLLLESQVELGEQTDVDLLLPDGRLLSFNAIEFEGIEQEELSQLNTVRDAPFSEMVFEGMPSLVSLTAVNTILKVPFVEQLDWTVVAHQARTESLAPVQAQQRVLILAGLAVLALSAVAAAYIGQTLIQPILRLTEVARQVAGGDLSVRAVAETDDEVGTLAATFNNMTAQLRQILGGLEHQVASRTRALETSIEVSRRLSTILDRQELVREVVEQVRAAFDYYHVHIYLFDEKNESLVMAGGTGEAGQAMMTAGHKLMPDEGIVGRAATTGSVVLVPDVSIEPTWLPNPLLPETKAETAVPIAVGDRVLGVLDVQHNIRGGLTQEDATLLQSIANQVAIALENARLFEKTQRRAEREALVNTISQKIQRATTVDSVLQIAALELGQALEARQTAVQLRLSRPKNGDKLPPADSPEDVR